MEWDNDKYSLSKVGLQVADHVNAMLAYWDRDLICRFANRAYLEWFGMKREQMINKISMQQLLGPLFEKNFPYITAALHGTVQVFASQRYCPS